MIKKFIALSILICSAVCMFGQDQNNQYGIPQPKNPDTDKMLKASLEFLQNPTGMDMTYTVKINDPNNKSNHLTRGSITLKEQKFYLSTPELEIWYDGENQWTYYPQNKEVNISSPDANELAALIPFFISKDYDKYYTCKYLRYTYSTEQQSYIHCLSLIPKNKNNHIEIINFNLFDQNFAPYIIVLNDKNGAKTTITLKSVKPRTDIDETIFRFDPDKHKGVEIVDLR